jgi:hypothetical protein
MSKLNGRCENCEDFKEDLVNGYAECPYPIPPFWLCENCLESLAERQEERKAAGGYDHCWESLIAARRLK